MTQTKRITDMTEGSPLNHIFLFTLPLLVGNLFQQFYNVVDSIVVGNYVGADALAAVGTCRSLRAGGGHRHPGLPVFWGQG